MKSSTMPISLNSASATDCDFYPGNLNKSPMEFPLEYQKKSLSHPAKVVYFKQLEQLVFPTPARQPGAINRNLNRSLVGLTEI